MSNRSMLEINHDYHIGMTDEELLTWARQMEFFLNFGDPKHLPQGVTFFGTRHHSQECPLGQPPKGWDNQD